MERRTNGGVLAPVRQGDGLRFAYVGEDGEWRETRVELIPPPARIETGEHRLIDDSIRDCEAADRGGVRRVRRARSRERAPCGGEAPACSVQRGVLGSAKGFSLALDGRKRQVGTVSSNPGHCLYCGIVGDVQVTMSA